MRSETIYKFAALALLIAVAGQRYAAARKSPAVEAYHANARAAVGRIPSRVGPWVGQDVPIPVQAETVLQPNALLSRRYTNVESGLAASVLIVQSADAHDMAGHFPLRCYPAAGWQVLDQRARDWPAGPGLVLTGSEFRFAKAGGPAAGIVVVTALLRPNRAVYRDMDAMNRSILGAGGQAAGAAQLQVIFDGQVPEAARDDAVQVLLAGHRPLIDAILEDAGSP